MIKEISNITESALPGISIACFAAAAFMGRKFSLAAGYGVSSKVADLLGKQNVAEEWNKASNDYWTQAKIDAFRDLTAGVGFFTLGVASNLAGKAFAKEEPKEEPGWCDHNPVLNTICEYKKSALAVVGLGTLYLGRARVFKTYRNHLITQRNNLAKDVDFLCLSKCFLKNKKFSIGVLSNEEPTSSLMLDIKKLNWWIDLIQPEKVSFDIKNHINAFYH